MTAIALTAPASAPDWEAFYHEHAGRVYRTAVKMLGCPADADDVTHDVLLTAMSKFDTFRGEAAMSTWLHRVTVNAVLVLRRKRATARQQSLSDPAEACHADPGARTPAEQASHRELRAALTSAVAQLPRAYRAPFVLSDIDGLPNADIADQLGLSVAAVKSRLVRGRAMLRAALASRW